MRFGGDQPYDPTDVALPPTEAFKPVPDDVLARPLPGYAPPRTPPRVTDVAGSAAEFAEAVGMPLEPWQEQALRRHLNDPCHVEPVTAPAGKCTPPRTPPWVTDVAKWRSLSRAERRALERHHRRQR